MGRPLKIAKSQAVLTITGTSASTQLVTVSETLSQPSDGFTSSAGEGIIAGMPFVVATTTGGLTAGVTYYVNQVVSAHTFSVSSTELSVQPRTYPTLTNAGPVTVLATVGLVDNGFNNPNNSNTSSPSGSSQSFGVVGGNTAQYGKQVLCNVAFGVDGVGTVFASTSSDIVTGLGTDFANVTAGSNIYAIWGAGAGPTQLLGTVSSGSNVLVGLANTSATGNIIGVDVGSDATDLVEGGPVVFDVTAGGIVAGQTYFVLNVANSAAFTITASPGGPEVGLSTDASVTGNAGQEQLVLDANSANNASGVDGYGDGYVTALSEAGYIVRQKGKTKYLVQGTVTGILGAAYTANVANTALTPNTMSIIATNAAAGTQYVSSLNDYQSELFPATVADGSLTPGSVYTVYYAGDTNWTAVGAAANITGVTFTATGVGGSGSGLAILSNANPDVIASFNGAHAANTYYTPSNPIVNINNA